MLNNSHKKAHIDPVGLIIIKKAKKAISLPKEYPNRNLDEGAIVTRYAPSPTGFIHIGALLSSFTSSVFKALAVSSILLNNSAKVIFFP